MELFHKILKTAVDGGASDVHLKIDTPVIFRINRQLIAIECPYPTEEWMNDVVEQDRAGAPEEEARAGARDRFFLLRAQHRPVPHQPLSAARAMVPGDALREDDRAQLRGTGPARPDQEDRRVPARHRAGGRLHRLRQIHHAGGDDRAHQRQLQKAHHHARGSRSNTCSRTTSASSSSAKSAWTRCPSITR